MVMAENRKEDARIGRKTKVRKRYMVETDSSEEDDTIEEEEIRPVIKLAKTTKTTKTPEIPGLNPETLHKPWNEIQPGLLGEIAIHPRKLTDLKKAMTSMLHADPIFGYSCRILICSGPSGSCKSTAVQLVARELLPDVSNPIVEYINPQSMVSAGGGTGSTMGSFSNFMRQCAVLTGNNKRFVVVEDIPNIYHDKTREEFLTSLKEWLDISEKNDLPPVVMIVTEYETPQEYVSGGLNRNFIAETVFDREILFHRRVSRIKFNPVAKTYLKKCLTNIYNRETKLFKAKGVSKTRAFEEINALSTNYGDVRSAIISFQFWSRFHSKGSKSITTLGKETNMGIFNALGKIIYGTQHKEEEILNFRKLQIGEYKLSDQSDAGAINVDVASVSNVLKDFGSQATSFNLGLLENYTGFDPANLKVDAQLLQIIDDLSIADLCSTRGLPEYQGNIAMRSVRIHMRNIESSIGTTKRHDNLKFSRQWKVQQKQNNTNRELEDYRLRKLKRLSGISRVSSSDCLLLDGFYEPIILNSRKSLLRTRYPRVGGSLNNPIYADSEIVIENEEDDYFTRVKNARQADLETYGVDVEAEEEGALESDDSDPVVDSEEDTTVHDDDSVELLSDSDLDNV
ncbi:unnamed protein product [Kuraishia capsulata CBS 1993]|uniref:Checkpoint protein RAD24-like helical bundle domain-containing protein n=1 Tax=Kuraishia capsulata CBS 1993 TaxID=1382522 RepID=W6MU36_9ASCO|nr:uncharacterized protein KUCA_T00001380001 [Kuraishia capsulata CBS 1993]CDK25410.1 unnamed protein product [Kuraishia capsulata CBS 1993]